MHGSAEVFAHRLLDEHDRLMNTTVFKFKRPDLIYMYINVLVSPFESLAIVYWPWVEPMASKTFLFTSTCTIEFIHCMYVCMSLYVHDVDLLINTVEPLYCSHPCDRN